MSDPLTAIREAERAGFDSSLIDESLALSYEQRAIHHQRALDLALEMERGGRLMLEQPQSTVAAAPQLRLGHVLEKSPCNVG